MRDRDDVREIKKLYELVALHELPLLKEMHRRVRYLTTLTWLVLLLIIISLIVNAIALGVISKTMN